MTPTFSRKTFDRAEPTRFFRNSQNSIVRGEFYKITIGNHLILVIHLSLSLSGLHKELYFVVPRHAMQTIPPLLPTSLLNVSMCRANVGR